MYSSSMGAFSWSELMTDDPEKAIEFYRQVIGWEVEAMPMEGGLTMLLKPVASL